MNLNLKNKIYLFIFSLIIIGIIAILVVSGIKSKNSKTVTRYDVSTNSVLFDENTSIVDTSLGGSIEKKWDNHFYYLSTENDNSDLGDYSIVFDKLTEIIKIYGDSYRVFSNGNVVTNKDYYDINNIKDTSFYKIKDRVYLIISPEIYNADRTVYANKYLIVYLDKQGNASILNDAINIKTINPMTLVFDNYTFDIANENLIIDKVNINLKSIIGSTNEYDPNSRKKKVDYDDVKRLSSAYNKLVSDFNQYSENANLAISSSYNGIVTNNYYIKKVADSSPNGNNSSNNSNNSTTNFNKAENKTNITKRVSLRGTVASSTYIDVSYLVTDPEDKYQAVYLLVTGSINNELATVKILLDKYSTSYRITGLSPRNEYSIALGYIEVVVDSDGNKDLSDNIEDVINVRTTKPKVTLVVNKIAGGRTYFTFKMYNDYAFEGGKLVLYVGGQEIDSVQIDSTKALSESGFSSSLKLNQSVDLYRIALEDVKYAGNVIYPGIYKNFTFEVAS